MEGYSTPPWADLRMKAPPPAPPASMAPPDQPGLVAPVAPWKGPANEQSYEQSYEQIQMQRWESPVAQGKAGYLVGILIRYMMQCMIYHDDAN